MKQRRHKCEVNATDNSTLVPDSFENQVAQKLKHFSNMISPENVSEYRKSNQGNQGYSGNQKNVIQGQRPDMENRHTHQRTQSN